MRRREGRGTCSRGAPGAWQMAQVAEVRSILVRRSAGFVENRTSPVRLNMRMRSMPCFSAMVCITWYAASRWSSSMACQVALVIALESWSAPKVIVLRSCPSSVLILTSPETAATMTTITVIESTSFWARRRGITGFRVRNYCSAPRGRAWGNWLTGPIIRHGGGGWAGLFGNGIGFVSEWTQVVSFYSGWALTMGSFRIPGCETEAAVRAPLARKDLVFGGRQIGRAHV